MGHKNKSSLIIQPSLPAKIIHSLIHTTQQIRHIDLVFMIMRLKKFLARIERVTGPVLVLTVKVLFILVVVQVHQDFMTA